MKILLAVDGSQHSEATTHTLASWSHKPDDEVLVLEVIEPPYPSLYSTPPQMAPGYAPEFAEQRKAEREHARQTVTHTAEELHKAGFQKVESRVAEGEARKSILDVAEEWHPDMIVLGSHGQKGLKRFLLGSVAESVTRHAPCSVLVVKTAA